MNVIRLLKVAALGYVAAGCGFAGQVILNGGFETANLANWTVSNQPGSADTFYSVHATTTPASGSPTVGPESGLLYAVSDGTGSGATALSQSFVVPANPTSVVLSYGLFVNSDVGTFIDPASDLNFSGVANQYGLVSLLSSGAPLFSTTTGDLRDFYKGTDTGTIPHSYHNYSFDITSLTAAGGTYTIRFAEVNNQDPLNLGVDNVSVLVTTGSVPSVPEPASITLGLAGIAAIAVGRRVRLRH